MYFDRSILIRRHPWKSIALTEFQSLRNQIQISFREFLLFRTWTMKCHKWWPFIRTVWYSISIFSVTSFFLYYYYYSYAAMAPWIKLHFLPILYAAIEGHRIRRSKTFKYLFLSAPVTRNPFTLSMESKEECFPACHLPLPCKKS